ncbi:MAG: LacI family DNA-binding transcriptional regulator [Deltaproteobacteria bacterium]|nr:LacI family DNA-binding transcriptional regulator [Deltaproteobacteria bacterium]
MGKRLPIPSTLKDVANSANVSIPIVSRVLSGNPEVRVSADTRQRILKAAKSLSYHPNASARSLKAKRTYTLALFVPDVGNPVIPEIIRGVEAGAQSAGYAAFVSHLDEKAVSEQRYLTWLQEGRFDGLILATARLEDSIVEDLVRSRRPFVLVNRRESSTNMHITVDDAAGARIAINHLVELGHRRIAHLAGPLMFDTSLRRLQGYRQELDAHGIAYDSSLVQEYSWQTWEGGKVAMKRLLQGKKPPTAVFASNFMGAVGALGALKEFGLKIPEDFSLVGLHDSPIAEVIDPPLTVVKMPLHEMGRRAAEILINILEDRPCVIPQVLTPEGLVMRKSTAPCRCLS